ncbi:hypothetical protein ACG3SL_16985 [Sphingomonas sp. CJ20]
MMEALEARGRAIGEDAVARVVARLEARVREDAPGVAIEARDDGVVLRGRDPALRWVGGLLR